MDYGQRFVVTPGSKLSLARTDPSFRGKQSHKKAEQLIANALERMDQLQYLLFADATQSLLVILQGLDAGGKDGVIRHIFTGVNPQGTHVYAFKEPSAEERGHDFLWRIHKRVPARGEIVIFNRSHYEDVLVVRVHELVSRNVWSERYELINDFEKLLAKNGTRILKFYLHISPEEQLQRFEKRLNDTTRRGRSARATIQNATSGQSTLKPMKTRSSGRARPSRHGSSFRQTTSGFATSPFRKSLPTRWTT